MRIKRSEWLRRARAFTLLEITIYLAMMGMFMLVSVKLWNATYTTARDAKQIEVDGPRLDLIMDRLKRDAWSAHDVRLSEQGLSAILALPGDETIVWSTDASGTLRRKQQGGSAEPREQSWPAFGEPMRFEASAAGLSLQVGAPGRSVAVLAPMPAAWQGGGR